MAGVGLHFAFSEDYFLAAYLVANGLCTPEDAVALSSLQAAQAETRELFHILGVAGRAKSQLGPALQSTVGAKIREELRAAFPNLPAVVALARQQFPPSSTSATTGGAPVESLDARLAPLLDELREQRIALGQKAAELEAWAEAAVMFLETIEALEQNPDIATPRRETAASLRKQFTRTFAPSGFQLISPEAGERVDLNQHYIAEVDSEAASRYPQEVVRCVQWGYRTPAGKILKAQVVVTPERSSSEP